MSTPNARGFNQYASFPTTYGETVRVYESSAAHAPHVWVSISGNGTAHLNVEQAEQLSAALDEFLAEIPRRWGIAKTTTFTGEERELLAHAGELVASTQFGSIAMLQRKMQLGFGLANRLMTELERMGVVTERDTAGAREVLVPNTWRLPAAPEAARE